MRNHAKNEAPKEDADPGGYSYSPRLEGYNSAIKVSPALHEAI